MISEILRRLLAFVYFRFTGNSLQRGFIAGSNQIQMNVSSTGVLIKLKLKSIILFLIS